MRCIYEALFCVDDNGTYHGSIPDIESCWADAETYEDVVWQLADVLEETLEEALYLKGAVPQATFGHHAYEGYFSTMLCVHVRDPDPQAAVSAMRAAEMLGVSRPRVTVLAQKGLLSGYHEGRNLFISLQSIYERLRYYPCRSYSEDEREDDYYESEDF